MNTAGLAMKYATVEAGRAHGVPKPAGAPQTGLFAGTRIASNLGWRSVEKLRAGDRVLTFDNGMQELREVRRTSTFIDASATKRAHWPVTFPAGALGNREQIVLAAHQPVMLECDAIQDHMGDPFAVVPAQALSGFCGIAQCAPEASIDMFSVVFAEDEVVYIEGGLLALCPYEGRVKIGPVADADALYTVLTLPQAKNVLQRMDFSAQRIVQDAAYVIGATEIGLVA